MTFYICYFQSNVQFRWYSVTVTIPLRTAGLIIALCDKYVKRSFITDKPP